MLEVVEVKKNAFLFEEGDPADCMYIIKTVQFSVVISNGETQIEVATAMPGQLIGEMSLFDKKFRSASAKALMDCSLIKLPYKKLEDELVTMPEWVQVTLKTLSQKIREANNRLLNI